LLGKKRIVLNRSLFANFWRRYCTQNQIVEHLREYLADIQDEIQWDKAFEKTQSQLAAAAQRARQEIADGQVKPLITNVFFHNSYEFHK
jgi:hypothetical protein